MEIISENKSFGGVQKVLKHESKSCKCEMTFALYLPPQAKTQKVPLLWWLSGLTCTNENAMVKAGFQQYAAEYGVAIVFPDTSPRGEGVADDDAYDLGQGAGFYLNASQEPWTKHFQMYDYIIKDLPSLLQENFEDSIDFTKQGIMGHSMGGHGALTIAFKNPDKFTSVSAFAPIANPTKSDWGRKQFAAYLGNDESQWAEYDSTLLLEDRGWEKDMLIDQGTNDQFLDLLKPEALSNAITNNRIAANFRMQKGYDHSYFTIATFAEEHILWHVERLRYKIGMLRC